MGCFYCGRLEGTHDSLCPKEGTSEMDAWKRGYNDGRDGKNLLESVERYRMGFMRGESALEEAQNGYQS